MNNQFFTPIANTKPYFKAAFEGFAGSGKTFTSALIAIGLHKRLGSKKPVVIFDTEKASKFLKPLFAKNNVEAVVKESRSLADLKETFRLMEEGVSDILIIDSITHVWENFLEAYKEAPMKVGRAKKTRLEFQDWGIIKPAWKKEFSEPFVNGSFNIIMTGRAGFEYENEVNEETGKREIFKSGVKMKVEGETAYEPDILVYMEQIEEVLQDKKEVYNQATVLKDRADLIQGKTFKNPSYEVFAPVVDAMLDNPVKRETPAERDASELIRTEDEKAEYKLRKKIILEEIEGYIVSVWPGMDAASKKLKSDAVYYAFETRSWAAIEAMNPESLDAGYLKIQEFVENHINGQKEQEIQLDEPKAGKPQARKKAAA